MVKTKLSREKTRDIYLFDTRVDNIFINEFMPGAPGAYVKVYLFFLMYAEQEEPIAADVAAKELGLTVEDIDAAWTYWEKHGVVKRRGNRGDDDYEVVFMNLISALYGSKRNSGGAGTATNVTDDGTAGRNSAETSAHSGTAAEAGETGLSGDSSSDVSDSHDSSYDELIERLTDRELQALFSEYQAATGRLISRQESTRIGDMIKVFGVTPDVFSYAIKYCDEIDKHNLEYICKVALRWKEEGCTNIADVKALLDRYSQRNEAYRTIFRELGFSRYANPGDREIMDRWLDEWGCTLEEVLDACRATAGLREPSLKYVNKVLENKRREAGGLKGIYDGSQAGDGSEAQSAAPAVSRKVLNEYYDFLQKDAEQKHKDRVREVCDRIPAARRLLQMSTALRREMITTGSGAEAREKRQEARLKLREYEERKRSILAENGYPEDYLERQYKCGICKDTGITDDGKYCACAKERAEEAYEWNKSRIKNQ